MSPGVWTYSESEEAANELVTAGGELAGTLNGESVTIEIGNLRKGVRAPAKILLKGEMGSEVPHDVAAEALGRAAKELEPSVILIGATRNGREISARLAAKLGWGCLSEATKLSIQGKDLLAERSVFAGKVVATVASPMPAVCTVKGASYAKSFAEGSQVREFEVGQISGATRLVSRKKKEAGAVDLKKAKVIVSAGRGVKRKEDLPILESLAKDLGGALGCSRPLSSDLGWLPEECHIGLTGVTVKPELYVAVGISGQLQHIAGMKDSKVVVAINTDKDAPIFQASDYGIVGDLYQVVPALRKAVASRPGK